MRDRTRVVLIAVAVLAVDQITKLMVTTWIPFQERIPLIDGLLALTHVRNTGAAFGLFSDAPVAPVRAGLIVVSVLAVGLIWAYAREGWHQPRIVFAFGFILGGALGNLIDRLRLYYVVDFVDVHWGRYHWPSFNVADMAITVGAISLFIAMARQGEVEEASAAEAD
ncbi:MAG: signal peptidase II [Acidobacteria bacterium]|nr:signal peptidase II [Acidobacteriota bacterium]